MKKSVTIAITILAFNIHNYGYGEAIFPPPCDQTESGLDTAQNFCTLAVSSDYETCIRNYAQRLRNICREFYCAESERNNKNGSVPCDKKHCTWATYQNKECCVPRSDD